MSDEPAIPLLMFFAPRTNPFRWADRRLRARRRVAAIYYVEPFTTYDADIIFVASDKTLSAGSPRSIASTIQRWRIRSAKHPLIKDFFPCQFLAASGLTERGCAQRKPNRYEGVPQKFSG